MNEIHPTIGESGMRSIPVLGVGDEIYPSIWESGMRSITVLGSRGWDLSSNWGVGDEIYLSIGESGIRSIAIQVLESLG